MRIEIQELELHPIDFDEEFPPGAIDFGSEVQQKAPLRTAGCAQLVEEHHGKRNVIKDIRLNGELSTNLELSCARCLEPVVEAVELKFDLLYRPQGADAGREELSIASAEAEVSYYQGGGLTLEDVAREQVLLSLPLRVICGEACKGLCQHCGTNLNLGPCLCAEPEDDPRWSALKDLRNKMNH